MEQTHVQQTNKVSGLWNGEVIAEPALRSHTKTDFQTSGGDKVSFAQYLEVKKVYVLTSRGQNDRLLDLRNAQTF